MPPRSWVSRPASPVDTEEDAVHTDSPERATAVHPESPPGPELVPTMRVGRRVGGVGAASALSALSSPGTDRLAGRSVNRRAACTGRAPQKGEKT